MLQITELALQEVKVALEGYREAVEATLLANDTKRTYLRHAETFVRWLEGDFRPGGQASR